MLVFLSGAGGLLIFTPLPACSTIPTIVIARPSGNMFIDDDYLREWEGFETPDFACYQMVPGELRAPLIDPRW